MPSIELALKWMYDRRNAVTYSMANRNGPSSYDCSSAVYHSLIQGEFLPASFKIGNTDSLFGDLEKNGWVQVPEDANEFIDTKRGDVFIWGKRGASGGSNGHTGWFVDANNIIHCSSGYNGIHVDNHDWLASINHSPDVTVYRYSGTNPSQDKDPNDQDVNIGSFIRFNKSFKVDEVIEQGGIWQVRTNELCPTGFTWADNGIPAEPLVEVDSEGYATPDQNLDAGSLYKIPGKFKVLDVGFSDNMWLAQLEYKDVKFWVDLVSATEVDEANPGVPVPAQKPEPVTEPPVVIPVPNTNDDSSKLNKILEILNWIKELLTKIFKG